MSKNCILYNNYNNDLKPDVPVTVAALAVLPLVLPSRPNGLRLLVLGLPSDGVASRATKIVIDLVREEIKELIRSGAWPAKLLFRTGRKGRAPVSVR